MTLRDPSLIECDCGVGMCMYADVCMHDAPMLGEVWNVSHQRTETWERGALEYAHRMQPEITYRGCIHAVNLE